ncbi:MAG: MFS transporter [Paracoccaceae bacterium]|jgi:MFS family permease
MIYILKNAWPILLGMMLLMAGNGLQGTLLGLRGAIEGFSPTTMSIIMSGYFLGLLAGSYSTPELIRRVGHVRVFAALGSLISAAFILYAAIPDPIVWTVMRVLVGFSFAGVYVVAESWLNAAATNETRGQALSAYVIVQMVGIVAAQVLLNFADVGGYTLFVLMSVMVSISFMPILLSTTTAPVFHASKRMSLKELYIVSPLGCVGIFLLGGIFAILFGMASVYGTEARLSIREISIFVGLIYLSGLIWQYPIGWISDRMDRRLLIMILTGAGSLAILVGLLFTEYRIVLYILSFIVGGVSNPLYSLIIAYTNDYLEPDDMASASGGLIFISGIGSVSMPLLVGWAMTRFGPNTYFIFLAVLLGSIAGYAAYRTTRRAPTPVDETSAYAAVLPQASPIAVEVAQEVAIEMALEDEETEG